MNIFKYSAGVKVVDGLTAVPTHITQVNATIIFDGASQTTQVTAEMQFDVGPDSGYPYFDLQQTISSASLDGVSIPVSGIAHHDFGGGSNADLRVIERSLVAGSSHTLLLNYSMLSPLSPNGQAPSWESGSTRLWFNILLSDLNPARYLESWLPSNLLFDLFPVNLNVQIINSSHSHTLLSNGTVSAAGSNEWSIDFPATFASCSPLIIIGAADRVEQLTTNVNLTGGAVIQLELLKRSSDTSLDLATAANTLATYLNDNHVNVGAYMHGNRYTAYLSSTSIHSMEYDGGTTSSLSALKHEVYHSWWARGMTPACGDDGWLDEGWTTYNVSGPVETPFDLTDAPVTLWQNNPFVRETPNSSYSKGSDFFAGLASELGLSTLLSYMSGIYNDRLDRRYATPEIEAELIRRSGRLDLARYFDRFVYGFGNLPASAAPDAYLRDAFDDTGAVPYSGTFWNSPDVWVRRMDDGGSSHQNPEWGQDNWFYARVQNRGNATARSFVVGFKIKTWAGTQFVYPGDWFPLTAATVGFDLEPGESKIVTARWPKEDIPPTGTHGCLLAVVYNSDDIPAGGAHVWEHNNLAQRNMTVVDLVANESMLIPVWIGSQYSWDTQFHTLELSRPKKWPHLQVALTHKTPSVVKDFFRSFERLKSCMKFPTLKTKLEFNAPSEISLCDEAATLQIAKGSRVVIQPSGAERLDRVPLQANLIKCKCRKRYLIEYEPGYKVAFPIALRKAERRTVYLQLTAPKDAKAGDRIVIDLAQRDARGRVVGGVSVQMNIKQ
jgi:hypothetical protein